MKGLDFHTSLRAYDARAVSKSVATSTGLETMVQKQFVEEVDINTIVRRFGITRQMPSGVEGGVYGDFTGITDFESAQAAVERAREGFMALSPDVRERFQNDPGLYLDYVDQLADDEIGPEVGGPARPAPPAVAEPPVAPVAPIVP